MTDSSNIKMLVLSLLKQFACTPNRKPNLQSHLFEDLEVGDDLIDFIAEVEAQLKIKIPPSEWEKVETVQDIITLVNRYISE